jgi:hypothetical protein
MIESKRGGSLMSCKKCASNNERSFKSELTIAFREFENVNQAPVYVCQDISVCLDCGHIEFALPPAKLELLKQEAPGPNSRRRSAKEGSLDS